MNPSPTPPTLDQTLCDTALRVLGGTRNAEEGMLDEVALHIEHCSGCQRNLDALAPEAETAPLRDRLPAYVLDQLSSSAAISEILLTVLQTREPKAPAIATPKCEVVMISEKRRAVADTLSDTSQFDGQLRPGQTLRSEAHASYVVERLRSSNAFSETYEARIAAYMAGSELQDQDQQTVVIKIPRIAPDMSDQGAVDHLAILGGLLHSLISMQRRLVGSKHVAQVIDHGDYQHRMKSETSKSVFVVYRYVDGMSLPAYLARHHEGPFHGIQSADLFFSWAQRLTAAVEDMHHRLVIHGDICPSNILVDRDGCPVFVNIGQSLFIQTMKPVAGPRSNPYRAPDSELTPSSDLFSLGAVLFYLATGTDPDTLIASDEHGRVKQYVEDRIRLHNPSLFQETGVVDVIARCLRKHERVQHAKELLGDIELCLPRTNASTLNQDLKEVAEEAAKLEGAGNELFQWAAELRTRSLLETMKEMNRGVLDFSGDPKAICSAACAMNRALKRGDSFLTLSLPQYFYPGNMGINGRFLTSNRIAAARGVRIERILLLDTKLNDPHLEKVVEAQRRVSLDLNGSANYSVKFLIMKPEARERWVRDGKHFGLFIRQGSCMAMFPVYGDDGRLVTLRFRTNDALVDGLRKIFDECLAEARPIADLRLPYRKRSGDGLCERSSTPGRGGKPCI